MLRVSSSIWMQRWSLLRTAAARLESANPTCAVPIFRGYPYTVVSTDCVKQERAGASEFRHSCPELVIVDEAHGCAASGGRETSLLRQRAVSRASAQDPSRHLILVTCHSHSGNSERRSASLVKPSRSQPASLTPEDLGGDENRRHRANSLLATLAAATAW